MESKLSYKEETLDVVICKDDSEETVLSKEKKAICVDKNIDDDIRTILRHGFLSDDPYSCRNVYTVQFSSPLSNSLLGYQTNPISFASLTLLNSSPDQVNWEVCYVDNGSIGSAEVYIYTSTDPSGYHWHIVGNTVCLEQNSNFSNNSSNLFVISSQNIHPASNQSLAVEYNPFSTPGCLNLVNQGSPFTNFSFTLSSQFNFRSTLTPNSICSNFDCKLQ